MRKILSSIFLGAAVACLAAQPASAAETKGKPLGSTEKSFIKNAGESAIAVLHLTEIIAPREGNPGSETLKTAGKALSTDLNTAWGELGGIAGNRGAELPKTDSSAGEKRQIGELRKTSTDKFDKAFLKAITKETKKLAKVTEDGAKQIQDPELKAWAEKWAPGLKGHHETLDKLEESESKKK